MMMRRPALFFCVVSIALAATLVPGCSGKSSPVPAGRIDGNLDYVGAKDRSAPPGSLKKGVGASAEGWTLIGGDQAPAVVAVEIDGQKVAETRTFHARKDVSDAYHHDVGVCGWAIAFPTESLAEGSHQIRVLVFARPDEPPQPLPIQRAGVPPSLTTTFQVLP